MKTKTSWLVTALLALPVAAFAQTDPANPAVSAPELRYQSAFSDYKPWQDLKPGNWRALNDALGSTPVSGHGGHGAAPVAASAAGPAPVRPASVQPLPAAGQDSHHMHGGHK